MTPWPRTLVTLTMPVHIAVLETPSAPMSEVREVLASVVKDQAVLEGLGDRTALLQRLRREPPLDLVMLRFPEGDGDVAASEILRGIRACDGELPVVAVAERGDVNAVAEAVAAGATDYLVRGDHLKERVATLVGKLRRFVVLLQQNRDLHEQNRRLREQSSERARLIGESPQVREVRRRIERVAVIPRPVLIVGERGTGKELVARAIHLASGRGDKPFVAVNCAAFPESLLESELFGHERGSFTGADRQAAGKFEQASGGTLFLDEISHMPLSFQQKILRVVEYGTFARVGGARELKSTARVLAASNADLLDGIRAGWFLPDLYDRLAFEVVRVPPLREREGDVELLARHFLREFLREVPALGEKDFDEESMAALRAYPFPGNVRELKTIIERAAYRDTTQEINLEDLALPTALPSPEDGSFEGQVEAFRRAVLQQALRAAGGNRAEAARRLGLAYHRFRYFAKKAGV